MTNFDGTTYVALNNINVNVISNSAGIFIGPNNQWGWSSHYKEVDIMTVKGNNNIARFNNNNIFDQDLVDTYINDQDMVANYTGYFGSTSIDLNAINIVNMSENVGTFTGDNNQFGWNSHDKTNSVNTIRGNNNTSYSRYNYVDDRDLCDGFINDPYINTNLGSFYGK